MYEITTDVARHRVHVTMIGVFREEDGVPFERDLKAAALRAKGAATHFDLLVDFTLAPVMSKSVSAESEARVAWCMANGLRKSANITGSALMKMQVARVAADDRFRMFPSASEAAAWLDAEG